MSRLRTKKRALADRVVWQAQICDYVQALAWSPDGNQLAAAAVSGAISIWNGLAGERQASLAGHDFGTTDIHWRGDSAVLASSGQDGTVRIWAAGNGQPQYTLDAGAAWVERVAWSPEGAYLAAAAGRVVRLWNTDGALLHETSPHPSTIADLAWMPGENTVAVCAYGGVVLWKPGLSEPVERFAWKGSCLALAWSPTGRFIAIGNQDATVLFLQRSPRDEMQMWGYPTKVRELAWSPTGRYLATGGGDTIVVWDTSGRKGPRDTKPVMLRGHDEALTCLAYQPGKGKLASAAGDGRVLLWQPRETKRPLAEFQLDSAITKMAWAPGGRLLAIGSESGDVAVIRMG